MHPLSRALIIALLSGGFLRQITIYLDDETERKMKRVVRSKHISQSRWVAELIKAQEAQPAVDIRARLESAGERIGPYDVLIAGTARAHGGTLVSRNQREFARVAGLQTVDWYK